MKNKVLAQMKFNPVKRILYTENGEAIKKLDCPFKVPAWEECECKCGEDGICEICNRIMIDTSAVTEEKLLEMIRLIPDACVKVDPRQKNVRIVYAITNL